MDEKETKRMDEKKTNRMDEKEKEWNKETEREEETPPPPPHMLEGRTRTSLPASLGRTADSASLGDAVLPSQNKHASLQYCWIFLRIGSSSGIYFPAFPAVLRTLPQFSWFIPCRKTDIKEKNDLFKVYTTEALCVCHIAGPQYRGVINAVQKIYR